MPCHIGLGMHRMLSDRLPTHMAMMESRCPPFPSPLTKPCGSPREAHSPFLSSESKAGDGGMLQPSVRWPPGTTPGPLLLWLLCHPQAGPRGEVALRSAAVESLRVSSPSTGRFYGSPRFSEHSQVWIVQEDGHKVQESNLSPVQLPPRWLPRFPHPYNHTEIPRSNLMSPPYPVKRQSLFLRACN